MKKKQMMIAAVVVIVLILAGGVFAATKLLNKSSKVAQTTTQKKKITDPVNIIDQADRPYIEIKPLDVHNVAIVVNQLKKTSHQLRL